MIRTAISWASGVGRARGCRVTTSRGAAVAPAGHAHSFASTAVVVSVGGHGLICAAAAAMEASATRAASQGPRPRQPRVASPRAVAAQRIVASDKGFEGCPRVAREWLGVQIAVGTRVAAVATGGRSLARMLAP